MIAQHLLEYFLDRVRRNAKLFKSGHLWPLVGGVYRLSEFHRALADFIAKDFVGKLVVVPDTISNSKTHL